MQVTDTNRPWARVNYNLPHWNFLGYYDARVAENQYALSSGAPLFEDSNNIHAEVQTNWDFLNKVRVVGGVAWNQQEVDTANNAGIQTLMLEAKSETQQSVFGQLDWNIIPKLKLVAAARWDDSTLHESQFSPKGALVYSLTPHHTIRYGYNEAFQRPNYSELFLAAPAGAPPMAGFDAARKIGDLQAAHRELAALQRRGKSACRGRAGRGSEFGVAVHDLFRWAIRQRNSQADNAAEQRGFAGLRQPVDPCVAKVDEKAKERPFKEYVVRK